MRVQIAFGVLLCALLWVPEASSSSGTFQEGGVVAVHRSLSVRYGYIHHGRRRILFYYRGHPRIYRGRPHCRRRCYIKYCYIRRHRVPVYYFTRRPVYGYIRRRSRVVRIVYIRHPHYFINRGRTCVLRGPTYRNYHGVRIWRSRGSVFYAGRRGCYFHGKLVLFGQSCVVSKCNVCYCTARDGFAHLRCRTSRKCVLDSMRRPEIQGNGYGVDTRGCHYDGKVIPFGSVSRVSKCKVCSCSGSSRSASVKCQIDNACLRGYCLYRNYKIPFGRSLVAGCKLCSCKRIGGLSKIICKTDARCLRRSVIFISRKPVIYTPSADFISSTRSHCLYQGHPVNFYRTILVNKCQYCTCVPRGSVPTFYCRRNPACRTSETAVSNREVCRAPIVSRACSHFYDI